MSDEENAVNWFEIPVRDLARATDFYEYVFGVTLTQNDMGPMRMAWFPMTVNGAGASGTLIQSEGYEPSHAGTLVYFAVPDIERSLERVGERGGTTLMPKMSIGEHGYIAHFQDSEGNRVALHSRT